MLADNAGDGVVTDGQGELGLEAFGPEAGLLAELDDLTGHPRRESSVSAEGLPGTWRRSHLRTVLREQPNARAAALRPLARAQATSFWCSQ